MATRTTTRVDDPATPDVDESQLPVVDSLTSAVSDSVALPDDPFTQEDLDELAKRLASKCSPFFLGNDVRSPESSARVAKTVLLSLFQMAYKALEAEPTEEPEPEPTTPTYPDSGSSSSSTGTSSTTTSGSSSSSSGSTTP